MLLRAVSLSNRCHSLFSPILVGFSHAPCVDELAYLLLDYCTGSPPNRVVRPM